MNLNPQQWELVKALFTEALERDPTTRGEFLAQAAPDTEVRAEVERLLAHHNESGGLLSSPGFTAGDSRAKAVQSQAFAIGEVVASRFRIVRFLARGGMGEVYEAEDLELQERVAVKSIRRELLCDDRSLDRFRREVHLARQVTHPNVCRIYDIFKHVRNGERDADTLAFVAMELLEGETLAEFLSRRGRLTSKEALPIAQQMALGLGAAHEAGIVHRDFKPGNVHLVLRGDGLRVVITDFGLALRSSGEMSLDPSITGSGEVLGTPAYMSPEQVMGDELTPASDVYSLGLVLYQMVTGTRAFEASTPLTMAIRRINEKPISPRVLAPDLGKHWQEAILRCLARDPRERFQNGSEVAAALAGEIAIRRLTRRGWLAAGVAATAVVATAIAGYAWYAHSRRTQPLNGRDTIVVADFTNRTGDPVFDDALKKGISVALEQSPFLNILDDLKVKETLKLMGRSADTPVTASTGLEICVRTGSAALLTGSIANLGNEYVLALSATNCRASDTLARVQVTAASKEKVLDALDQATAKVRQKLGESRGSIQKFDTPIARATTTSLDALKIYSLADKEVSVDGYAASIPLLKRAVQLDPQFAMAYAGLALSYYNMGEASQASKYIEKAYELRERTSELEKLRIIAYYNDLAGGNLSESVKAYQLWAEEYPRSESAHINLGATYFQLGQYQRALEEFLQARDLEPDDGVTYANLIGCYAALNRLDQAREVYLKSVAQHLDSSEVRSNEYGVAFLSGDTAEMARQVEWSAGKPGIEDIFLSLESDTDAYYGRLDQAREHSMSAVELARRNGESESAAQWELESALQQAEFGNSAEARKEAEAALTVSPTRDVQAVAALVLAEAGQGDRGIRMADDLEKRFPQNTIMNCYWLPSIRASAETSRGQAKKAIALLHAASGCDLANAAAGPGGLMQPVYARGQAYLLLKDGKRAETEFERFIQNRGVVGNGPLAALANLGLARAEALEGDTARARTQYRQVLDLWKDATTPVIERARAEYGKLK